MRRNSTLLATAVAMAEREEHLTSHTFAAATGIAKRRANGYLNRSARAGWLRKTAPGEYVLGTRKLSPANIGDTAAPRRRLRDPHGWGNMWAHIHRLAVEHGSIRSRDLAAATGLSMEDARQVIWHHYKSGRLRRYSRAVYGPTVTSIAPKRRSMRHPGDPPNQRMLADAAVRDLPLSTLLREAEHELDQPAFVPRVEHASLADYREDPERYERLATGVVRVVVQSPDGSAYASIGGGGEP